MLLSNGDGAIGNHFIHIGYPVIQRLESSAKFVDKDIYDPCPVPRPWECCCPIQDEKCSDGGQCPFPTIYMDIFIDLEHWQQNLSEMIEFVQQ